MTDRTDHKASSALVTQVRHPWLVDLGWFTDACDRLMTTLDDEDILDIGINVDRDRPATAGVRIETMLEEDQIDDLPGIRRIERRAPELARGMPCKPPFGATVKVRANAIAVDLRWHHPGWAMLLTGKVGHVWQAVDVIVMPERLLSASAVINRLSDGAIVEHLDRMLGGGRLDTTSRIHAAKRRDNEIRVTLDAGTIRNVAGW